MGRGRKSETRKKIATILSQLRTSYGYKIYKIYRRVFGGISKRSIYYHLNKGVDTGEFVIVDVISQEGDFTWGNKSKRVYYALGPRAKLSGVDKEEINKIQEYSPGKIDIEWEKVVKSKVEEIKRDKENIETRKEKIRFLDRIKELRKWINSKLSKSKSEDYQRILTKETSNL